MVGHRLFFQIIYKNCNFKCLFLDLTCYHGNRYDFTSTLKVLPNNKVAKMFIVCLRDQSSFLVIGFHRFTNTTAT